MSVQFGTLGSGNHFVEVCSTSATGCGRCPLRLARIGNQLATRHIADAKKAMKQAAIGLEDLDLAYFTQGTPEFAAYIDDMLWSQAYAMASRARMDVRCCRTRCSRWSGRAAGSGRSTATHNFTQRETHHGKSLWITRKGAIKADTGDEGVIPGSMGTRSYIVRGEGQRRLLPLVLPRGGPADVARRQAKRTPTASSLKKAMEGRTWNADRASSLVDEHPGRLQVHRPRHGRPDRPGDRAAHTLRQVFNYKG